MSILSKLGKLSPTVFENLIYDLVTSLGFAGVIWRTPGADGGRDIEASFHQRDALGEQVSQSWYIECKRYRSSISWPTIYSKISHADAHGADFLLLATNSNPSPSCESEISRWNCAGRSPAIRVWRGYQIVSTLSLYPAIEVKFGLSAGHDVQQLALQPLLLDITKIVHAANAAAITGGSPEEALFAAAVIGELIQQRMADFAQYGQSTFVSSWEAPPENWLTGDPPPDAAEEVGLSAFAGALRYVTAAQGVCLRRQGDSWQALPVSHRLALSESAVGLLRRIAMWTRVRTQ